MTRTVSLLESRVMFLFRPNGTERYTDLPTAQNGTLTSQWVASFFPNFIPHAHGLFENDVSLEHAPQTCKRYQIYTWLPGHTSRRTGQEWERKVPSPSTLLTPGKKYGTGTQETQRLQNTSKHLILSNHMRVNSIYSKSQATNMPSHTHTNKHTIPITQKHLSMTMHIKTDNPVLQLDLFRKTSRNLVTDIKDSLLLMSKDSRPESRESNTSIL